MAWGWGTISLANVLLDRAPAEIHPAVIADLTGSADKDPAMSLRVIDAARPLPVLTELEVSKARYAAARIGGRACVAIHPGRLGWRTAEVVDCPSAR